MKKIRDWASSILEGYLYVWEGGSLYVLITSMLACLVHIWTNYMVDTAITFTVLIGIGLIAILGLGYTRRDEFYHSSIRFKPEVFAVVCGLTILSVIACVTHLQLGLLVITMAVVPQGVLAFADEYMPMENQRQVITRIQDITRILTLVFVTICLLLVWLKVDVSNMVKISAVVVYLLLIPVINLCQDELPPVYEVVNPW